MSAKLTRRVLDQRLNALSVDTFADIAELRGWYLEADAHVRAQDEALREIADECAAWGGKPKPLGLIGSIARAARMEE